MNNTKPDQTQVETLVRQRVLGYTLGLLPRSVISAMLYVLGVVLISLAVVAILSICVQALAADDKAINGSMKSIGNIKAICGNNTPAMSTPRCRHKQTGVAVSCSHPNAINLWTDLQPLDSGQYPSIRDTTRWNGITRPGHGNQLWLWHSVYAKGQYIYTAYNAGIQVWELVTAISISHRRTVDGWLGGFPVFPLPGENDYFIHDVAAFDYGGERYILVAGRDGAGFSAWRHDADLNRLVPIYQRPLASGSEVDIAESLGLVVMGGYQTVDASLYSIDGIHNTVDVPAIDTTNEPNAMFVGMLGSDNAHSVEVVEIADSTYVAVGRKALNLEIWRTEYSLSSGLETQLIWSGLGDPSTFNFQGVDALDSFVDRNNRTILAAVHRTMPGQDFELVFFDLSSCGEVDDCEPVEIFRTDVADVGSDRFLTYSEGILHYGVQSNNLAGSASDMLLSVHCAPEDPIELGASPTYHDNCSDSTVGFLGEKQAGNTHGHAWFRPRRVFCDDGICYRAGYSTFDYFKLTADPLECESASEVIFTDDFESGDLSQW